MAAAMAASPAASGLTTLAALRGTREEAMVGTGTGAGGSVTLAMAALADVAGSSRPGRYLGTVSATMPTHWAWNLRSTCVCMLCV